MKFLFFTILLLFSAFVISAQTEFKNLRFDENYSFLRDSVELNWYEQIKYTRLNHSGNAYLSFGGETRFQYFKYENEDWGDTPPDNDGFILSRLLLHGDLHVNHRIRLFTQLQSSVSSGRDNPSPLDQNELDIHQLFFDVAIINNDLNSFIIRAGRQELSYGSARLISVREGPNNRHSFDGVKFLFKRSSFKSDIFYSTYVGSRSGIFNDKALNDNVKFGGIYNVWSAAPFVKNIDFYYLTLKRVNASWNDIQSYESRHSVGTRIWGKAKRWQYDFEGVFQFGDFGGDRISAWTMSANTNCTLGSREFSPTVGIKTEFISGDEQINDSRMGSFNPLFPRGAYFGYAALIGPSNLIDIHPSVSIPLRSNILLYADYDIFWRYSLNDGIYNPGTFVIYPAGDSREKFIGQQLGGNLEFSSSKYVFLRAEVTWFKPGGYIKSMGAGKEIFFTGFTTTLKF